MTLSDLYTVLAKRGFNVDFGEDNDGQIVIYTNKRLLADETIVDFQEEK